MLSKEGGALCAKHAVGVQGQSFISAKIKEKLAYPAVGQGLLF
jgi:hypothetical protein